MFPWNRKDNPYSELLTKNYMQDEKHRNMVKKTEPQMNQLDRMRNDQRNDDDIRRRIVQQNLNLENQDDKQQDTKVHQISPRNQNAPNQNNSYNNNIPTNNNNNNNFNYNNNQPMVSSSIINYNNMQQQSNQGISNQIQHQENFKTLDFVQGNNNQSEQKRFTENDNYKPFNGLSLPSLANEKDVLTRRQQARALGDQLKQQMDQKVQKKIQRYNMENYDFPMQKNTQQNQRNGAMGMEQNPQINFQSERLNNFQNINQNVAHSPYQEQMGFEPNLIPQIQSHQALSYPSIQPYQSSYPGKFYSPSPGGNNLFIDQNPQMNQQNQYFSQYPFNPYPNYPMTNQYNPQNMNNPYQNFNNIGMNPNIFQNQMPSMQSFINPGIVNPSVHQNLNSSMMNPNLNDFSYQNNNLRRSEAFIPTQQTLRTDSHPKQDEDQLDQQNNSFVLVSEYDKTFNKKPRNEKSRRMRELGELQHQVFDPFAAQAKQRAQQQRIHLYQKQLQDQIEQKRLRQEEEAKRQIQRQIQEEQRARMQLMKSREVQKIGTPSNYHMLKQPSPPRAVDFDEQEKKLQKEKQAREKEKLEQQERDQLERRKRQQELLEMERKAKQSERQEIQRIKRELQEDKHAMLSQKDVYRELISQLNQNVSTMKNDLFSNQNQLQRLLMDIQQENLSAKLQRQKAKEEIRRLQQAVKANRIVEEMRQDDLKQTLQRHPPTNENGNTNPLPQFQLGYGAVAPDIKKIIQFDDNTQGIQYHEASDLYNQTSFIPLSAQKQYLQQASYDIQKMPEDFNLNGGGDDMLFNNSLTQAIQMDDNVNLNIIDKFDPYTQKESLDIESIYQANQKRLNNLAGMEHYNYDNNVSNNNNTIDNIFENSQDRIRIEPSKSQYY